MEEYGATEFNSGQIYDQRGAKLRFMFTVHDQEKALSLYKRISSNRFLEGTDQAIKIFYLKTEPEFEKYADEEAENFYKE